MEDTRSWIIAKKETEEGLSTIRIKKFENNFDFSHYPERVSIIWDFQDSGPKGSPSENDFEAMRIFEDDICKLIESDNQSILSIVFLEPDYRQWDFYCHSVQSFIDCVNNVPQTSEPFPIEIYHESDETWEFYKSYAKSLIKA